MAVLLYVGRVPPTNNLNYESSPLSVVVKPFRSMLVVLFDDGLSIRLLAGGARPTRLKRPVRSRMQGVVGTGG